jgi:hypothetical protein
MSIYSPPDLKTIPGPTWCVAADRSWRRHHPDRTGDARHAFGVALAPVISSLNGVQSVQ